jgi:hypothetical protein
MSQIKGESASECCIREVQVNQERLTLHGIYQAMLTYWVEI